MPMIPAFTDPQSIIPDNKYTIDCEGCHQKATIAEIYPFWSGFYNRQVNLCYSCYTLNSPYTALSSLPVTVDHVGLLSSKTQREYKTWMDKRKSEFKQDIDEFFEQGLYKPHQEPEYTHEWSWTRPKSYTIEDLESIFLNSINPGR